MSGIELVAAERKRQMEEEGWTPEHDSTHIYGEIVGAARAYAWYAQSSICKLKKSSNPPLAWPWDNHWWKPSDDPIRNLVKAAALICAEIDRIQAEEGR